MTDREKLISLIKNIQDYGVRNEYGVSYVCQLTLSTEEIADYLLSHGVTVREPQKPLTVEDILVSPFQIPCWIERNKNGRVSIAADVLDRSDYDRFFGQVNANMMRQGLVDHMTRYRAENYGKTWRCWAEKPTEEERKAAEWEQ